jgi:FAD/FMN-containing dehydrogenase
MEITIQNGGTVSAEHGIGKIKKEFFHRMYDDDAISQMKAIKRSFDPNGILNRGNLF